ncbi:RlmE family RNA methyltransferase [Coxiella endosymbiont of Amblyomma americanum]|uniref:RlmE family RNA methyltransferase n=1 Tax=Coxiella endosymbiont of Amblyomma americanum TaxID=325775 RepID=UPI00057D59EC|nr:RlmE family RNA methyltransferase [Coxiella endosymbiont of Amblyomma americanum]AJC50531.1 23S rRNA methyltransferase [Coxiella endosymbiont of Amblyomma americanum]AUJ58866.1 23S rRNA methyltransferase [Coxiella-like endosymbiont of Amblyomma americanum]
MTRNKHRWPQGYNKDFYVRYAKQKGYVSRAAFKLLEINEKYKLFKPGMSVVDLGAAPGGWFQVVENLVGPHGFVVAVDLTPINPILKGEFIQGDLNKTTTFRQLSALIYKKVRGGLVNFVISDMAPNISGIKDSDQSKALRLAELAWNRARIFLRIGGGFLVKLFQSPNVSIFLINLRPYFRRSRILKPHASHARSSEIYILATEFLGYNQKVYNKEGIS